MKERNRKQRYRKRGKREEGLGRKQKRDVSERQRGGDRDRDRDSGKREGKEEEKEQKRSHKGSGKEGRVTAAVKKEE